MGLPKLSKVQKYNQCKLKNQYLLISSLFIRKEQEFINRAQFEHLAELEIVCFTEQGIELVNNDMSIPIDCQSTATVDWQSIGTFSREVMASRENGLKAKL